MFKNNCVDSTKCVLEETDINEGITIRNIPDELVKDGTIEVIKGDIDSYLKEEPNGVAAVEKKVLKIK